MTNDTNALISYEGVSNLPAKQLREEAEYAVELGRNATAESTQRVYAYQFASFKAWCIKRGYPYLPTTPAILATFLGDMHKKTHKASRLGLWRAAVLWTHAENGHDFDSRALCVKKVMAGARKSGLSRPRKARAFLDGDFAELSPHMGDDIEAIRDRAMLELGLALALRGPSELLTLDLDRIGTLDARGYIEVGSTGVTVHLVRTKTMQDETRTLFVERGPTTEALERWVAVAKIGAGEPLWRAVFQGHVQERRMHAATWHLIVKRRIRQLFQLRGMTYEAAKKEADEHYSTHSLRSGGITSMADLPDVTIADISAVTGHAPGSAAVVMGYMQKQGAGPRLIKRRGH